MATITFKGNPVQTSGELPAKGASAPDFTLVKSDLTEVKLSDFKGKYVVLNIFPSLDTGTCAASVRRFNKKLHLWITRLCWVSLLISHSLQVDFAQLRVLTM